ncbi:MAG: hypothetical protein M1830_005269, partial [Pleopsidium flavum]
TTVRFWECLSTPPPTYDSKILSHGSAFINAISYHPPTADYTEGLVISGGKDTIIEVRQLGKAPEEDAEALLLGHAHNVCSLDVSSEGGWVVSGSWDASARVWRVGKWECEAVLEGHEGSVWDVLAYDPKTIITGMIISQVARLQQDLGIRGLRALSACADKLVRVFTPSGKLVRTIKGNTDVVRALCQVPKGHPTGADFASASNDGVIRLWTLAGRQVGELHGHDSFIYSLTSLPSGELVSSGEDRTVRIWRGNQCVQTITHPAISVWAVAACSGSGDIVSGASDRIVRVFSRDKARYADQETLTLFDDSVKSSSIPQQQLGEVNKEKLPGPDFLQQKSGTKEGQVVMIREGDGSVTAHQWSQATQTWISVGTVVDAVGSSGKKQDYLGKDYDYVFDVDIEDGKPPLKLPYNLAQNPYEAATKFIEDNELPIGYLDQVANFITTNTQGATLGQSTQPPPSGADPLGTESRYRPGETSSTPPPPSTPASRPKVLPQTTYLSIKTANLKTIQKKIEELNQLIIKDGSKDLSLNPSQLEVLQEVIKHLEQSPAAAARPSRSLSEGLELVVNIVTMWPPQHRLPGLDLLRLLAATPVTASYRRSNGGSIIDILEGSGVFADPDRSNNIMLAVRAFANLFDTPEGRQLADNQFDKIHTLVKSSATGTTNRNVTIAATTVYINYAVLYTAPNHSSSTTTIDRALKLLDDLTNLISTSTDSEAVYRCLVGCGTLLQLGEEVKMA